MINDSVALWAVEGILKGSNPLPERLEQAWRHISDIETKELPSRCHRTFERIKQYLEESGGKAPADDIFCHDLAMHFLWFYCQLYTVREIQGLIREYGLPRGSMRALKKAGLIEPEQELSM